MRTDLTFKNDQIEEEVIKIQEFMRGNVIHFSYKSKSAIGMMKKSDMLAYRDQLLTKLEEDIIRRSLKNPNDIEFKVFPGMKDLNDECRKSLDKEEEAAYKLRAAKREEIHNALTKWLGDDIKITVGDSCYVDIDIKLPGEEKDHLRIDLYYRDPYWRCWMNDAQPQEHGSIEFNFPTWGSWDPKTFATGRKFFEVCAKITNDPGFINLDYIRDLMDEHYKLGKEYREKASVIRTKYMEDVSPVVKKILEEMEF